MKWRNGWCCKIADLLFLCFKILNCALFFWIAGSRQALDFGSQQAGAVFQHKVSRACDKTAYKAGHHSVLAQESPCDHIPSTESISGIFFSCAEITAFVVHVFQSRINFMLNTLSLYDCQCKTVFKGPNPITMDVSRAAEQF